jgi:hypothetical protein
VPEFSRSIVGQQVLNFVILREGLTSLALNEAYLMSRMKIEQEDPEDDIVGCISTAQCSLVEVGL